MTLGFYILAFRAERLSPSAENQRVIRIIRALFALLKVNVIQHSPFPFFFNLYEMSLMDLQVALSIIKKIIKKNHELIV